MISASTAPPDPALLGPPPPRRGPGAGTATFPRITPGAEPGPVTDPAPKPGAEATAAMPPQRRFGKGHPEDPGGDLAFPPLLPAPEPGPVAASVQVPGEPPSTPGGFGPSPDPALATPGAAAPAGRPPPVARPASAIRAEPAAQAAEPAGPARPQPGHQTRPAPIPPENPASHIRPGATPTPVAPTGARAGEPQSAIDPESRDSQSRDSQGGGFRSAGPLVRMTAGSSASAAQSLPFRLESGTSNAPGATALPESGVQPATSAAPLSEAGASLVHQGADVVIGIDSDQRLDVTIATATRQAADRVEAARADLQRDLSALGAEVEAIRVEVRSERAPDAAGQSGHSATAGGQSDRQGQAMRDRNERPGEPPMMAAGPQGQLAVRAGLNPNAGRIDRYA
ncbi:MAG: hypothetical protein KGZ61_05275 [Sandarakinorhabdus sp.]|nr:hypothetical protein [Sandarakinorhabdus sp.]